MSNAKPDNRELGAIQHIKNALALGKQPSIRTIQKAVGYKSPHTAMLLVQKMKDKSLVTRDRNGNWKILYKRTDESTTRMIPIVGCAPCGLPMLAEQNIEAHVPVSTKVAKPSSEYFFLRAIGDSMNKKGINNDDLVLFRQQPSAESGQVVVALIDGEATIKEFHPTQDAIALIPRSTNPEHHPIIVDDNFQIQGVMVSIIPKL